MLLESLLLESRVEFEEYLKVIAPFEASSEDKWMVECLVAMSGCWFQEFISSNEVKDEIFQLMLKKVTCIKTRDFSADADKKLHKFIDNIIKRKADYYIQKYK
jgi:hypothetical protein